MYRKPDWEARLAAFLESVRLQVFAWGSHDCCMFTGDAVEAMTDVDPMPEFRGKYRSAAGASRALRTIGAGDLPRTLDGKFQSVPPALAQRGDIIMHDGLLGICLGAVMVCVGLEGEREGLVLFDRSMWIDPRAWRVEYGS
ncbi:DUF6950 family protein [Sphingomonas aurantiaca]